MNTIEINENMTMGEVIEKFPSSQRALFQKFHIGGCQSCGYSMEESIDEVCKKHNKDIKEVIDGIYQSEEVDKKMRINVADAKNWLNAEHVEIIDVREPYEVESGIIENSRLLDRPLLGEIMTSWPKNTKILSYCQKGDRSAEFASYLIGHGFSDVKTLEGGIEVFKA